MRRPGLQSTSDGAIESHGDELVGTADSNVVGRTPGGFGSVPQRSAIEVVRGTRTGSVTGHAHFSHPFARIAEGSAQPARPSSRSRQSVLAQKNTQVIVAEVVEPTVVAAAVGLTACATSPGHPHAKRHMPVTSSIVAKTRH